MKTQDSCKKVIGHNAKVEDLYGDKDLDGALDSFDNLFCRRCLVSSAVNFHILFGHVYADEHCCSLVMLSGF